MQQPPLPSGWTEHKAPTGHTYYYNASTKASTYTRPQHPPATPAAGPPAPVGRGLPPKPLPQRPDSLPARPGGPGISNYQQAPGYGPFGGGGGGGMGNYPQAPGFGPFGGGVGNVGRGGRGGYPQVPAGYGRGGGGFFPPGQGGRGRGSFHRGGGQSSFQHRQGFGAPQKKADRPKTKREIPDATPWVLVTTLKGNRFVHNPQSKVSLFTPPDDVMKAMEKMKFLTIEEEQQLEKERITKKKLERATISNYSPPAVAAEGSGEAAYQARGNLDSSTREDLQGENPPAEEYDEEEEYEDDYYDEDEEMEDEHETKRLKTGGKVVFGEDDIAWQMQAMAEAYGLEEEDMEGNDEDDLTMAESISMFREMLEDLNINPYNPWEKEMPQMVDDGRYVLLPTTKKRVEVFGEWTRDKMARLKAEKEKQVKLDPRIPYLRFLETNATLKLYWPEFKRKFKKEPEMKDMKVTDKDREKYYRDYTSRTKASLETRESDLRKLLKSTTSLTRDTTDISLPTSISCDIRYVAVPRDRREEILADYVRTLPEDADAAAASTDQGGDETAEAKKRRALMEREEAVRRDQRKINYEVRQGKEMLRESEMQIKRAMDVQREGVLTHLHTEPKKDEKETEKGEEKETE